jgi:hypothetical protein
MRPPAVYEAETGEIFTTSPVCGAWITLPSPIEITTWPFGPLP